MTIIAYDTTGNELERVEFNIDDLRAESAANAFLEKHAPPAKDIALEWAAAFAEARASNRRVWVRVSGRYCGPCFLLSRWLDDHAEVLAKDFVMLKIDESNSAAGQEYTKRLAEGRQLSIPLSVIYDADEAKLADSFGPTGKAGFFSGYEGQKQLRKMLLASRQKLNDAEVEALVESVSAK